MGHGGTGDIVAWDPGRLRLGAGSDISYVHGLELVFSDPVFVTCPSFFQGPVFVSRPTFQDPVFMRRRPTRSGSLPGRSVRYPLY